MLNTTRYKYINYVDFLTKHFTVTNNKNILQHNTECIIYRLTEIISSMKMYKSCD